MHRPPRPARPAPSSGSPAEVLCARSGRAFIDEKLSGCGTHMEQIVFVHDLFLNFGDDGGEPDTPFKSQSQTSRKLNDSNLGTCRDADTQTIRTSAVHQ